MGHALPTLAEQIEGLEHLNRKGWYYITRFSQQLVQETTLLQQFLDRYYAAVMPRLRHKRAVSSGSMLKKNNNYPPQGIIADSAANYEESAMLNSPACTASHDAERAGITHRQQKQLYRHILRRCHPDAQPPEGIARHTVSFLTQAREAYQTGDTVALNRLALELERHFLTPEEYVVFLKERSLSLRQETTLLRESLRHLRNSAAYQLYQRFQHARQHHIGLMPHILRELCSEY